MSTSEIIVMKETKMKRTITLITLLCIAFFGLQAMESTQATGPVCANNNAQSAAETITLKMSDGQERKVDKKIILAESGLLKNLAEDVDDLTTPLDIPRIDSNVFDQLYNAMRNEYERTDAETDRAFIERLEPTIAMTEENAQYFLQSADFLQASPLIFKILYSKFAQYILRYAIQEDFRGLTGQKNLTSETQLKILQNLISRFLQGIAKSYFLQFGMNSKLLKRYYNIDILKKPANEQWLWEDIPFSTTISELREYNRLPAISGSGEFNLNFKHLKDLDGLLAIPGIEEVTALYADHNQITTITRDILHGLPKLKTLSLYGNHLTTITPDIFNELPDLKVLNLSNNRLNQETVNWIIQWAGKTPGSWLEIYNQKPQG